MVTTIPLSVDTPLVSIGAVLVALLDAIRNCSGLRPSIIAVQNPAIKSQNLDRRAEGAAELRLVLKAVLLLQLVAFRFGTDAVAAADDGFSILDGVVLRVLDVEDGFAGVCELGICIAISVVLCALL
jgi:hypothetical protein